MRRPGGLWRHHDFRTFWAAETISQFGSQVTFLALPLVAIVVLGESAFRVALLTSGAGALVGSVIAGIALGPRDPLKTVWDTQDERSATPSVTTTATTS